MLSATLRKFTHRAGDFFGTLFLASDRSGIRLKLFSMCIVTLPRTHLRSFSFSTEPEELFSFSGISHTTLEILFVLRQKFNFFALKKYSHSSQLISIVLPCYNPINGWCETLVDSILELNKKLPSYTIEYIISNDGSTRLDKGKMGKLMSLPNVVFLDNPVNEGKGSAIRKGTTQAEGEIIIYTDIDFPFGTDPVVEIVRVFSNNPDCWFVYGNRDSEYFQKLPFKRKLVSKVLLMVNRILLSRHVTDTQAGIKGLRREVLPEVLGTKTNSFVFEIELIRKLIKKKIEIKSVNVCANSSIIFSDFSMKVLCREVVSLSRIIMMGKPWNGIL